MTYARPPGGLGRLLVVIPWLIKEREAPIREMERRFAIDPEQLVKDMEALNEVDFFVSPEQRFSVEITGERVKVLEAPNFPATPGFLPFEALACLVAAKTALEINPQASDLRSAVEKLETALIPDAARTLRILSGVGAPWVDRLGEWAMDRRVVRLRYRSTDKGEMSEREVEPWQVYQWTGTWYLWGFDRTKGEARRFRVDGIRRARPTGESFKPPPPGPPSAPGLPARPRRPPGGVLDPPAGTLDHRAVPDGDTFRGSGRNGSGRIPHPRSPGGRPSRPANGTRRQDPRRRHCPQGLGGTGVLGSQALRRDCLREVSSRLGGHRRFQSFLLSLGRRGAPGAGPLGGNLDIEMGLSVLYPPRFKCSRRRARCRLPFITAPFGFRELQTLYSGSVGTGDPGVSALRGS